MSCINTYIWKPEKWYRWTYLQSSRDTDIENKSMGTTWGKRRWDELGNWSWHMYTEGNGTPLQYSCLENPMDGGEPGRLRSMWSLSRTWLSGFTFTFHFQVLEKEMATHSSVLAWRMPGRGEPGGLPSMGSHRVGHDWSDLAVAACIKQITNENLLHSTCWSWNSQFFGHLMQRTDSWEKTLMMGKIEGRRRGRQDEMVGWHHRLNGHEFE